ncbi:hypothetical protein CB1_000350065 [Camelus ferus]|nr:hypothetical protein CB1_000350065 [Camelus ferus]
MGLARPEGSWTGSDLHWAVGRRAERAPGHELGTVEAPVEAGGLGCVTSWSRFSGVFRSPPLRLQRCRGRGHIAASARLQWPEALAAGSSVDVMKRCCPEIGTGREYLPFPVAGPEWNSEHQHSPAAAAVR